MFYIFSLCFIFIAFLKFVTTLQGDIFHSEFLFSNSKSMKMKINMKLYLEIGILERKFVLCKLRLFHHLHM